MALKDWKRYGNYKDEISYYKKTMNGKKILLKGTDYVSANLLGDSTWAVFRGNKVLYYDLTKSKALAKLKAYMRSH